MAMGRSTGTVVSVKVPINWEIMTQRQRTRLSRITSRDTRVIRAYLGIIARHESSLIVGKKKQRIHPSKLDQLTLTALRHKDKTKQRKTVLHDFKSRFSNISQNELQECRDIAIQMWNSYLERGGSPPLKSKNGREKKIPRNIFSQRFQIVHRSDLKVRYWLEIRDSLDSARKKQLIHEKLTIPLKMSPYHLMEMQQGQSKSCRILKDEKRKWWVILAVIVNQSPVHTTSGKKPFAVMGIDLGINKAACVAVLTDTSILKVRYLYQHNKQKFLAKYEQRIASLQREMRIRQNFGQPDDKVVKKLRELNRKRASVNEEWDRVLVSKIVSYAIELSRDYNLYVAVGNPKGIRGIARKKYSRGGRRYRGLIHRWAFSRIILKLEHHFAQLGWTVGKPGSRFLGVYEGNTSITCCKCGHKGIRPKQSHFLCHTCGYRDNADKNGAINIARRMIRLTPELRDERKGLGLWLFPHEKNQRPKARRKQKSASERKSSLSKESPAPFHGESAAVHSVQMDLLSFGDESKMCDEDPAVENAAEKPTVFECLDSPRSGVLDDEQQRKEAVFRERNHVSMTSDNAHVTLDCQDMIEVSDDSHEFGGTQELQADCEIHSPSQRRTRSV